MNEANPLKSEDPDFIRANISKMMAETMKLSAETAKIQAEIRYYPLVALGAVAIAGIGTVAACVIKLLA